MFGLKMGRRERGREGSPPGHKHAGWSVGGLRRFGEKQGLWGARCLGQRAAEEQGGPRRAVVEVPAELGGLPFDLDWGRG